MSNPNNDFLNQLLAFQCAFTSSASSTSASPSSTSAQPASFTTPFPNPFQQPLTQEQLVFLQLQQQMFQHPPSTPNEQQFTSSNEIIPETQPQNEVVEPSSVKRKGKGKAKAKAAEKTITRTKWSQDEELLLAETWISISEDPNRGKNLDLDTFWMKVVEEYNENASFPRNKDMITGKWTTLTRDCAKFLGIVNRTQRLSGENDDGVFGRCLEQYQQNELKPFNHIKAFGFLRHHSKWYPPEPVVPGRRRRSEDVGPMEPSEDPNELFRSDPIQRPPGNPRKSKSQRSDTSGSGSTKDEFKEMVSAELREERALKKEHLMEERALKKEHFMEKTKYKALKFLGMKTKHLSEEDLALVQEEKEKIRQKYKRS